MNIEELRDYCLSLNAATESFPFGEETLVFKINGKIFLLVSLSSVPLQFNVNAIPNTRSTYGSNIRRASYRAIT